MDLLDVIKTRHSIRSFKPDPVPESIITEMLEAARHAPSGGNAQTHCFGVITDEDLKVKLAAAAGHQMWIATAPVVFACCADISWDMADVPEDDFGLAVNKLRFGNELINYLNAYEDRKAVCTLFQNAAPLIPAEHIFLTAAAHGLGGCFVGYPDVKEANTVLNLPSNLTCLFLLPVGYPDEASYMPKKKEISEISFCNRFDRRLSNMNNYEYTKLYYSYWIDMGMETFDNPGITLVKSEKRKIRQVGYPANFEVYCLAIGDKLFISYNQNLDITYNFYDEFTNIKYSEEALLKLNRIFPNRVHRRKVFYHDTFREDIDFREVIMLKKEDYRYYHDFFITQNPHLSPDGWLEEYYRYLAENHLCFGIFKDDKLVSVTDSPFIPYIPEAITEPGINTLEEYRGKGYAKKVCAAFIKNAIDSGKVPIWTCRHDNKASVKLAESLGYREFADLYTVEGGKDNG